MLDNIQNAIVLANNFGDWSVSGDDLKTAAAMSILLYLRRPDMRDRLEASAGALEEFVREAYPEWASQLDGGTV